MFLHEYIRSVEIEEKEKMLKDKKHVARNVKLSKY